MGGRQMASDSPFFRIDPLVVFKLGQELISSEVQALLELIKNAYDADASFVVVRIDTQNLVESTLLDVDADRPGFIEIADDGVGMDADAIRDGWLLIARSQKMDFKTAGKQTGKERTPLGDKGLGRLGAQRLGWGLQIETKTAKSKDERLVAFSWEDFYTAESLDKVEVRTGSAPSKRKHGTTLTVTQLNEPERWRGDAIAALQRDLSQVISPYEGVSDFSIAVSVDGAAVDLQSLNRDVRDTAQLQYEIGFDGKSLEITGRATLNFFRPIGKNRQPFADLVESDEGKEFYGFLSGSKGAEGFNFKRGKGKWFVEFKRKRSLTDVVKVVGGVSKDSNPGPFHAEIDSFDLAAGDDQRLEVFGSLKQYRDFIKDLAGIRVYRDGFAVRVDQDWLGLGAQWTSATSYYGLKPDTTTGYVAITSRENPNLVEKTDREGFSDSPEYRVFRGLMGEFISFTSEVQDKLRREFNDYFKLALEARAEVEPSTEPSEVAEAVEETLREAEEVRGAVSAAQSAVHSARDSARDALGTGDESSSKLVERAKSVSSEIEAAMAQAESALTEIDSFLSKLDVAKSQTELLREEIAQLHEQVSLGVETMSLGLTAEALSHEMFNISDGLSGRTQKISRKLESSSVTDAELRGYVEYVRSTVGALRKELGHFSPSLRYVRAKKESFLISDLVADTADYFEGRGGKSSLSVKIQDKSGSDFSVRGSRGKLTQVLDNLMLNSDYWLARAETQKPTVTVKIERPFITVSDNGPGVEPSVESTLFDPFVSRKPRGEGRGLGLFVVRQLLEGEGCSVALGTKRNSDGRRHEFVMNLSGMLDK